jgi:hypothetical protein
MSSDDFVSPFFSEDVDQPHSPYWAERRELAAAARELQELLCTSDIPPETAKTLTAQLRAAVTTLRETAQFPGVVAFGRESGHGNIAVANHELLAVGGHSHPGAPGLRMWHEGELTRGSVECNWSFEGPPGHVHGGWIAAIFDHFMGIAHLRGGKPGMTGGLSVRYLAPTPLNTPLALVASQQPDGERRTLVSAELRCGERLTATAEAVFVRPRRPIF